MKKLVSLIACLLCAAMLATVGFAADAVPADTSGIAPISNPEPDAYAIYKRASKSLDSAESVEMSGIVKTTMRMGDITLGEVYQNSLIRMITPADGNIQMEMRSSVKTTVIDSTDMQTIEIYYKDGYMYTKAGDETHKVKMDIENAAAKAGSLDAELTRDAFKDATVEETEEGTRVNFTLSLGDTQNLVSVMGEMAGISEDPGADIKIGDITYSMLIGPDNSLKAYDAAFDMDMTIEGATVNTKTKASYEIVSINKVGSIDFPSGLVAY